MGKNFDIRLKEVGQTVKSLRKNAELGQSQLAERIEISHRHMQKIEAGTVDLPTTSVFKIGEALEIPACHLLNHKLCSENVLRYLGVKDSLLDLLPSGIIVIDSSGMIRFANRIHLEHLGIKNEEGNSLIKPVWEYFAKEKDYNVVKNDFLNIMESTGPIVPFYRTVYSSKAGKDIPMKVDCQVIRNSEGKVTGILALLEYDVR